jgi:hypothetical protein
VALVEHRLRELDLALEPAHDSRAVVRTIIAMMLTMPSARGVGADPEAVAGAYVMALGDLPQWAIDDAAMRFARGQVPKHNAAFAPSAAEIRQEAERMIAPVKWEAMQLRRILEAKVVAR